MARAFLRDSRDALLFLATLVGCYYGAVALDLKWSFWVLLALSLAFASGRWIGPKVARWIRHRQDLLAKGEKYDQLLRVAGENEYKVGILQRQLLDANSDLEIEFLNGLINGRRRVVAEWLSGSTDTVLRPLALAFNDDEPKVLTATAEYLGEPPRVGSHWLARVAGHPAVRAAFSVRSTDLVKRRANLILEYAHDQSFASMLETRVGRTSDFPSSVELERRQFATIEDLVEEG